MRIILYYNRVRPLAKIYIERAYIEPFDGEEPNILFHVKQIDDNGYITETYAGKVELDRFIPYTYMEDHENGDLEVITSGGRKPEINHIIGDILYDESE